MDEPYNPVTSVGGLLCSKLGEGIGCFGEYLPDDVVTNWANGVRTQLVFEAEILPYLLSLSLHDPCWHIVRGQSDGGPLFRSCPYFQQFG